MVKTKNLKAHFDAHYDAGKLEVIDPVNMKDAISRSDLIINTTPLGMKDAEPMPIDKELLRPGAYLYDLVYNRPVTPLVKAAQARKLHASTGLGMLLYQGAIAFEIWTGHKAPVGIMKKALKEALKV